MSTPKPLTGVRVLAMEHFIAGPWCTQTLADAGAEVIKIERQGVGDPRRNYDPYVEQDGVRVSGGFASYNRNKQSVAFDVTKPEARDVFLDLVDTADVIVENMRPGLMEKFDLSYEVLRERNPRLIYCAISGFGRTSTRRGAYSDWPAFDPIVQAMSGLASLIGEKDGPPLLAPSGSTDLMAGNWAAMAVCMALLQRAQTGEGQFVDVAMYDVAASFLGRPLMIQDWVGETMTRGLDTFTPVGLFRCGGDDGYVAVIIPTDDLWRRTCAAIDRPDLLEHPRLSNNLDRSQAMAELVVPALEAWSASLDRRQACDALVAAAVPAGMVQTVDEVDACTHLAARDFFVTVDDPIPGPRRYPRLPVLFGGFEGEYIRPPLLGEHTADILDALGVDGDRQQNLRERGIIN